MDPVKHRLDEQIALSAIQMTLPSIRWAMEDGLTGGRNDFYVAVYSWSQPWHNLAYDPDNAREAREAFDASLLATHTMGHPRTWEHPYDKIATSKGFITWRTGLPTRAVQTMRRDLLWPEDTKYWGSALGSRHVVAGSGVQPFFDEHFSKSISGAYDCHLESPVYEEQKDGNTDFYTLPASA